MSDDSRRPGDDEIPADPPTGEGEVVGADWLLSQLGNEPTGEHEVPVANRDELSKAGDSSVLAWWRQKLIAADALVNPEPRPDVAADEDEPVLPEPGWTARQPAERTESGIFASRRRTDDEPRPVEPRSDAETVAAPGTAPVYSGQAEPNDEENESWSLDNPEPDDEPETGLIPLADQPPIFQPRSAREHIFEETAKPGFPETVVPAPAARRTPEQQPDPSHEPSGPTDASAEPPPESTSRRAATYDVDDTDDFQWGLSPNDQPDPLVHRAAPDAAPPARKGRPWPAAKRSLQRKESAALPAGNPPPGPVRRAGNESAPVAAAAAQPAEARPTPKRPLAATRAGRPGRAVMLGALAVGGVLLLAGLIFLGTRLPVLLAGPAPTATSTPSPSATAAPTPTVPAGPAAPGEQAWTALAGGECLEPYNTPWAETFTVVDCGAPHAAQLVVAAPVDADPAVAYPGEEAIVAQIDRKCSAPGVLDATAAEQYTDLQVQGTYPVSEEQWAAGERNYYCFVSRSSGEPITGSLAGTPN